MQSRSPLPNTLPTYEGREVEGQEQSFRREGEYWSVCYEGRTCRLRESKGLLYLAYVLRCPGKEIASWELIRLTHRDAGERIGAAPAPEIIERARVAVTKNIKAALGRIREHHPTLADHLDATVRRGYACVYRPDPRVPTKWDVTEQ